MDITAVLNTYSALMSDIKERHRLLTRLLVNPGNLPGWAVVELSQLQVRMICEVFAIACLVAHGDVEGTRTGRLVKAYQADLIINALENLHPWFYPRPSKQVAKVTGPAKFDLVPITDQFLTKEELINAYRSSYDFLHAGTLKKLVLDQKPRTLVDPKPTAEWARKLVTLLNHHHISLIDPPGEPIAMGTDGVPVPKRQIIVIMQSANNGQPQASLFERLGRVPDDV